MLFKNIYIPIEIQIYILSKIKDTKGYKTARLVCKDWYQELKVIKIFNNQKIIKYITFSPKEILVYNSSNQILEKTKFKSYGEYTYYKYNNNKRVKSINNIPLKTVETIHYNNINYNDIPYEKKIYNIENNTLKTIHLPFPFLFPHPIQGNVCTIS
tara:strand:- start:40 stop:507 length:468 start_codon:yes stop_codon:yes gene_type:complete